MSENPATSPAGPALERRLNAEIARVVREAFGGATYVVDPRGDGGVDVQLELSVNVRCHVVLQAKGPMSIAPSPDVEWDDVTMSAERTLIVPVLGDREDPRGIQRLALRAMVDAGGQITPQELHARLNDHGVERDPRSVQSLLRRLVERGYITKAGHGAYTLFAAPASLEYSGQFPGDATESRLTVLQSSDGRFAQVVPPSERCPATDADEVQT